MVLDTRVIRAWKAVRGKRDIGVTAGSQDTTFPINFTLKVYLEDPAQMNHPWGIWRKIKLISGNLVKFVHFSSSLKINKKFFVEID